MSIEFNEIPLFRDPGPGEYGDIPEDQGEPTEPTYIGDEEESL